MPGITPEIVVQILREPAVRRINFRMGNCRVYPEGFETIARAIETRRISVQEAPHMPDTHDLLEPGVAIYSYGHDGFYFPLSPEYFREQGYDHMAQSAQDTIERHYGAGYLTSDTRLSMSRKALIIHEAVHAIQDFNRVTAVNYLVEGAGYIAQMMYRKLNHGDRVNDEPILAPSPGFARA